MYEILAQAPNDSESFSFIWIIVGVLAIIALLMFILRR